MTRLNFRNRKFYVFKSEGGPSILNSETKIPTKILETSEEGNEKMPNLSRELAPLRKQVSKYIGWTKELKRPLPVPDSNVFN